MIGLNSKKISATTESANETPPPKTPNDIKATNQRILQQLMHSSKQKLTKSNQKPILVNSFTNKVQLNNSESRVDQKLS